MIKEAAGIKFAFCFGMSTRCSLILHVMTVMDAWMLLQLESGNNESFPICYVLELKPADLDKAFGT